MLRLVYEDGLGMGGFRLGLMFCSLLFWYLTWLETLGKARISFSVSMRIVSSAFFYPKSFSFLFLSLSLALMAI